MRCSDFVWEWDLIREEAGDAAATEFMPRIATTMYASMRSEAGEYVDAQGVEGVAQGAARSGRSVQGQPERAFLGWHLQDRHGRSRSEVSPF